MNSEQLHRPAAATLEAVAAAAGVSRSTVSRVVNGSPRVSPEVLAAVNSAIDSLNYVPNRAARTLANRHTMAIALVVPEDTTRFFGDPYFATIMQGIAQEIEKSDYVLNLQLAGSTSDKTVRYLRGGNVDGALVVSHHTGDHFLAALDSSLPIVFGGRPLRHEEQPTYFVDVDNTAAAAMGTQHLIDIGRRRIATIAGPADMPAGIDRTEGWRRALNGAGLTDDLIVHGDFSLVSGAQSMRHLLEVHPDIDGLFVASDLMAMGAVSVLRSRGISIPEDIAIVGFDDNPLSTGGEIELTTVHQPSTEMGQKMAAMLLALLRGESPERECIMETRMVFRESA